MSWLLYSLGAVAAIVAVGWAGLNFALRKMVRQHPDPALLGTEIRAGLVNGKRVLVVGGTSGLGRAIAQRLSDLCADVTVAGRSDPNNSSLKFVQADFSKVKNQMAFARAFPSPEKLDIVVFTVGILAPSTLHDNGEGIELDLATSYISRRVIVDEFIIRGFKGRFVIMGFPGTDEKLTQPLNPTDAGQYKSWAQHMNTVVANDALVLALRHRGIDAIGLNPGLIATNIRSYLYSGVVKNVVESLIASVTPTPEEYAKLIVNIIAAEKLPENAAMFNQKGEAILPGSATRDRAVVERIWSDTERLIAHALKEQ